MLKFYSSYVPFIFKQATEHVINNVELPNRVLELPDKDMHWRCTHDVSNHTYNYQRTITTE